MGQRQTSNKLLDPNERTIEKDNSIKKLKDKNYLEEQKLSKNHFEFMYIVGRGGFGKVWKVFLKKNKKVYAMKEMLKAKVIDKKSERSIKYERDLLAKMKHPFIVNLQYAFQDFENLFLALDFLPGGDLRYHISKHKKFTEQQTKFFIACLLLSFEYVHGNNIIHRDIKPENMVIDDCGFLRITDFGIAKLYSKDNSSETSGTPGYMAPEVMVGQNHTMAVDYFALGVFGYEFMHGCRPYLGRSRKEIKEQIMSKQVQIKKNAIPENWSIEAADFINKCLIRKPVNRLGFKGINEAKYHPWFNNYPWKDLYNKKIESPFFPKSTDNFDRRYCESVEKIGIDTKERYEAYMQDEEFPLVFRKFTYVNKEELLLNASNTSISKNSNNKNYTNSVFVSTNDSNLKLIDRKEYSKSVSGGNTVLINDNKSSNKSNLSELNKHYNKINNNAKVIINSNKNNINYNKSFNNYNNNSAISLDKYNKINIMLRNKEVSESRLNNEYLNKTARPKIKINPSSSIVNLNKINGSNNININDKNISNNKQKNIINQLKESKRNLSNFKEKKIIGVGSSIIFGDKSNVTSNVRSSSMIDISSNIKKNANNKNNSNSSNIYNSISKKNIDLYKTNTVNKNNSMINFEDSNLYKVKTSNYHVNQNNSSLKLNYDYSYNNNNMNNYVAKLSNVKNEYNNNNNISSSRLPGIDNKLDILKKINYNPKSNNIYSSRESTGSIKFGSSLNSNILNNVNCSNKHNIIKSNANDVNSILGLISKRENPTKVISMNSQQQPIKLESSVKSYTNINSKREN